MYMLQPFQQIINLCYTTHKNKNKKYYRKVLRYCKRNTVEHVKNV